MNIEQVQASLERMQQFDVETLIREKDLGAAKNFQGAVAPATRLVELYRRLTAKALQDFPEDQLRNLQNRADSDYQLLDEVLKFDADRTTAERDRLIGQIDQAYSGSFSVLASLIAYSLHRSADFQQLDADARAALRRITDQTKTELGELNAAKSAAAEILNDVRKLAAEGGVAQQAHYFKESADTHEDEATVWRSLTYKLAGVTGAFAVLSIFLHRWSWIAPRNSFESVQLVLSKILIFAVLSFLLFLAARSFTAHKHNAIVNRHRQQALQTFKALVVAAGEQSNRDIILTHAAACIFSPQPTGYGHEGNAGAPNSKSVVELIGSGATKNVGS